MDLYSGRSKERLTHNIQQFLSGCDSKVSLAWHLHVSGLVKWQGRNDEACCSFSIACKGEGNVTNDSSSHTDYGYFVISHRWNPRRSLFSSFANQLHGWFPGHGNGIDFERCTMAILYRCRASEIFGSSKSLGVVASIFAILHFLDWWYEPADAFRRGLNTQTPMVAMVELRELPQIIPARAYHPLRRGESHPRVKAHIAITSVRQNRDGTLVLDSCKWPGNTSLFSCESTSRSGQS